MVTALVAGCDSLPTLPEIDLSGWFGGNHGTQQIASLDVVQREPYLIFHFHKLALKDASVDPGSNEITLHFDGDADPAIITDVQRSAPDWIAGTQVKDNSATIVAGKDVEFSTTPDGDGFNLTLKPRAIADAGPAAAPTVAVETDSLSGDTASPDADIDGLQREGSRDPFGAPDPSTARDGL